MYGSTNDLVSNFAACYRFSALLEYRLAGTRRKLQFN